MGCEQRSAAEFAPFIRIAEQVGVDAVQLYQMELMHASKPGVDELERYFRTLLEGMTIPARLSTHQQNGYTTPIDLIDRLLHDYPHIEAIHCTTDIEYMRTLVDVVDGRADILLGGAQHLLPGLSFGATGYLDSTGALLAPRLNASVIEHYEAGRLDEMATAYHQITRLSGISRVQSPRSGTGSVRVCKAAMRVLGLPGYDPAPAISLARREGSSRSCRVPEGDDDPRARVARPERLSRRRCRRSRSISTSIDTQR